MSKVEMFLVERPVVISRTASHIKKVNKAAKRYCLKRLPFTAWNPTEKQKERRELFRSVANAAKDTVKKHTVKAWNPETRKVEEFTRMIYEDYIDYMRKKLKKE